MRNIERSRPVQTKDGEIQSVIFVDGENKNTDEHQT